MNRKERRRQEKQSGTPEISSSKAASVARARVKSAERKLQQNDPVGAAQAISEALEVEPENPRAHYLAAMIAFNAGRLDEAADSIVKATLREKDDAGVHANCAAIMNVCGRPMEAEAAARFALEIDPAMAEAYCNLGVALEAQGKPDAAKGALERAIHLRAGYVEALISLGNLSFRTGEFTSAAEAFASAIQHQPENAMARTNLAIALRILGELAAAEAQCHQAIALAPSYAEAYNALGNVLLQLGDVPGAVRAFRDAVARRDTYPEAWANLGGALFKAGEPDEAIEAYQSVIEKYPTFAEASHGLGVVHLSRGDTAAALDAFRKAVEVRETLGEAWMNIVDAVDEISESDLEILRRRAADARLADDDRTAFHFALGAAEHRRGDYEAAFEAYSDANGRRLSAAVRDGLAFEPDEFDVEVDTVCKVLDRETLREKAGAGDAEAEIVFICGMPRSGTSLVEQTLCAHSAVRGAGEADILSGLLDAYPDDLVSLTEDDIRTLSDIYLQRLPVAARGGVMVTDKTPQNVFFLGFAQVLFPNAKVIHCKRDPRDVLVSCYRQNFKSAGLAWSFDPVHIQRYAAAEARAMEHWRATLELPIYEVEYEELVADFETGARGLIEFLGLPWEDAVAAPHQTAGTVLTASNWQVRKPVYHTSVGGWQNYAPYLEKYFD